jgi:hypothetical protein
MFSILTVLAAIFVGFPSESRAEDAKDILIIANKSLAATAEGISPEEVKSFFLKQKTHLGNAKNVVAIHARPGTLLRKHFCSTVLGMTEAQEATYWQNRRLKTGDTPPPEFSDPLRAVFGLKRGLGYIFRGDLKGSVVDVIAVIPFVRLSD